MKRIIWLLVAGCWWLVAAAGAQEIVLVLKNGERIYGQMLATGAKDRVWLVRNQDTIAIGRAEIEKAFLAELHTSKKPRDFGVFTNYVALSAGSYVGGQVGLYKGRLGVFVQMNRGLEGKPIDLSDLKINGQRYVNRRILYESRGKMDDDDVFDAIAYGAMVRIWKGWYFSGAWVRTKFEAYNKYHDVYLYLNASRDNDLIGRLDEMVVRDESRDTTVNSFMASVMYRYKFVLLQAGYLRSKESFLFGAGIML